MRKQQLCASLRRDVQRFLAGFSIAQSWSMGTVDWRHDPGILGLELETEFTVDFHVEKYTHCLSHLDVLLGEGWDVRHIAGTTGYRAVLTLELKEGLYLYLCMYACTSVDTIIHCTMAI